MDIFSHKDKRFVISMFMLCTIFIEYEYKQHISVLINSEVSYEN